MWIMFGILLNGSLCISITAYHHFTKGFGSHIWNLATVLHSLILSMIIWSDNRFTQSSGDMCKIVICSDDCVTHSNIVCFIRFESWAHMLFVIWVTCPSMTNQTWKEMYDHWSLLSFPCSGKSYRPGEIFCTLRLSMDKCEWWFTQSMINHQWNALLLHILIENCDLWCESKAKLLMKEMFLLKQYLWFWEMILW